MPRILAIVLMTLWMPVAAGCSLFAKAPMDVLTYQADATPPNRNLIVFLRGIGGSHRSFESEGLVADIRARGLPFDMVAPNAHLGYYSGRTLIERLREDVILPARAQGYEQIWLVGFSMGGLGSLLYIREQPQDIQGVCLIAPFLGDKKILREIEGAGGVLDWAPGTYDPDDDWQRMLWHWIQTQVRDGGFDPPVYLFFGEQDSYVEGQQLLAAVLPPERVGTLEGRHDIATFKNLWRQFIERQLEASRGAETSTFAAKTDAPIKVQARCTPPEFRLFFLRLRVEQCLDRCTVVFAGARHGYPFDRQDATRQGVGLDRSGQLPPQFGRIGRTFRHPQNIGFATFASGALDHHGVPHPRQALQGFGHGLEIDALAAHLDDAVSAPL